MAQTQGKIAGRWARLDAKRSSHLKRARACAELTLPSLLPPVGADENTELPAPYQGLGARAVNNLSAKLLLALFPANSSFFRLDPDEFTAEQMKADMGEDDFKTKIAAQLRKVERMVTKDFEAQAHRTKMFKVMRLLVVTGNTLIEQLPSGTLKVYRLDHYVNRRNPAGEVVEIVIRELILEEDIPDGMDVQLHTEKGNPKDDIELFTRVNLVGDKFVVSQEILGEEVPGSKATYPKAKVPFISLAWSLSDGENYGRGHVDEQLGDFISYDDLSKSLLEGAAGAAKLLFMNKPNSTTNIRDLQRARNGQFITGNAEDISVLTVEKASDFRFAYDQAIIIEQRLSRAFLLTESIQRNAERVTAEEIRVMAQEIEDALGGVYSVLGVELQRPLATLLMASLKKRGKMPALPKEIETTITTGFEALGRGHDLAKLREFRGEIVSFNAPDLVTTYLNISDYLTRAGTALGIDTDGLVPTKEQIDATLKQQKQEAQMAELAKTGAATAMAKGAIEGGMLEQDGS